MAVVKDSLTIPNREEVASFLTKALNSDSLKNKDLPVN